jgi:predicted Zn-dependent protease
MFFYTKKVIASLAALVVLTGCAQNLASGGYDFVLGNEEDEFEWGHEYIADKIDKNGLYKESLKLENYYKRLANEVVAISDRSDVAFDFVMMDTGDLNAWAIPGYVNMHRGILPFLNSEEEFVAVLAHEVGHVVGRHSARSISKQKLTGVASSMLGGMIGSYTQNKKSAELAAQVGSKLAGLSLLAYGRSAEDESDMLAVRYLDRLGYDNREAYNAFRMFRNTVALEKKIYAFENDGEKMPKTIGYNLLSSHPQPQKRLDAVVKRAGKPDLSKFPEGRNRYLEMIDGLAYGPNFRKYGAAGERNIYFPKTRLVWKAPESFQFKLSPQVNGWRGYSRKLDTTIVTGVRPVSKSADGEAALRVLFPGISQIQTLMINGEIPAYTGIYRTIERGSFGRVKKRSKTRIFLVKGKGQDYESISGAHVVAFTPPVEEFARYDAEFFDQYRELRLLSVKEAKQLQPLRIKIHTVKEGETVSSISEKMAMGAMKKARFSVLNNIDMETPNVRVGQKVKLVVDPNLNLPFLK